MYLHRYVFTSYVKCFLFYWFPWITTTSVCLLEASQYWVPIWCSKHLAVWEEFYMFQKFCWITWMPWSYWPPIIITSWYTSSWKIVDMLLLTFSGVVLIFKPFWSISIINCTELSSVKVSLTTLVTCRFFINSILMCQVFWTRINDIYDMIYDNVNYYIVHHTDLISDVQTGTLKACVNLFSLMHSLSTSFCLIYFTNSLKFSCCMLKTLTGQV